MKKILLLAISVLAITFTTNAQKKMGYLNTSELIQTMPETKKIQEDLEKYYAQLDNEFKILVEEYQAKVKKYEDEAPKLTESMKEVKIKEIRSMEQSIQEFREGTQAKLMKKEDELSKPVMDKIKKAIEDVGKEGNYDYIFNAASLEYAKDGENITNQVKAKLGIK